MNWGDFSSLEAAVIKTLLYRDLFDYPLTAEEVYRFLIKYKSTSEEVVLVLEDLVRRGVIGREGKFYFLPQRGEIVSLRKERTALSQEKLSKVLSFAKLLRFIPWVQGIFVTGALAVRNARKESDLDILIVSRGKRVWLTRLLVTVILDLLGKRVRPPQKIADRVCPNIFISEESLALPRDEQNLYTAHETVQVRPLWEREEVYGRFLASNRWVLTFLPNIAPLPRLDGPFPKKKGWRFLDRLEEALFRAQLKHMEKRRTREIATSKRIFFHPVDLSKKTLSLYQKRLSQIPS
jgi:hypothetical protein